MNEPQFPTRREILKQSLVAGAAMSLPWIMSSAAVAREGAHRAERQNQSGRHRHWTPLHVRSRRDAQAARRPLCGHRRRAGQPPQCRQGPGRRALQQQGLRALSRHARTARPQGYRRRDHRHRRPLACGRLDVGGQGRQGRLQRKTLRDHNRAVPGIIRHHETHRPGVSSGHPAAQRPQFPTGHRAGSQRQARQDPHALRVGLLSRNLKLLAARRSDAGATWSIGICGWGQRRGARTTMRM